jgi:hypothetical protein
MLLGQAVFNGCIATAFSAAASWLATEHFDLCKITQQQWYLPDRCGVNSLS